MEDLLLEQDEPFPEGPAADTVPQPTVSAVRGQSQEGDHSQSRRQAGTEDMNMAILMQIQQKTQDNGKAQALAAQEQALAAREQAHAAKEQSKRLAILEAKLKSMESKRSRSPSHRGERKEPSKARRHN